MARGNVAKENVANKLREAFGQDWIGEFDKKYYIYANDGGEKVQIAITLTCPKNPIQVDTTVSTASGDWDFSDDPKPAAPLAVASAGPAEITEEEQENLKTLLEKLGL